MLAKLFQILAFIFLESWSLSEGVNIVNEEHITELIEKIVADKTLELKIQVQKLENVVENQQSRINNLEKEGRRNERIISYVKKLWADMYHELKSNSWTTPDEDLPDTVKDNFDVSANNTEDSLIGKDRNASIDLEQNLATRKPNSNRRDKRVMKYRQRRVPEVVAFTAYLSHNIDHMGVGHHIVYDRVITNEWAGYNVHTGIFTAPLTGLYLFTYSANSHYVRSMLELVVDGNNIVDIIIDPVSNIETNVRWSKVKDTQFEDITFLQVEFKGTHICNWTVTFYGLEDFLYLSIYVYHMKTTCHVQDPCPYLYGHPYS